jgi:hypothetical protein
MPTVIRSIIWGPSVHRHFPESFRKSCKEILLCSHAPTYQPSPLVTKEQINVASQLPRSIWLEILSYTHRDWFARPRSEEEVLRRRLEQEQQAALRAQEARFDAEARLRMAERERDSYRLLALRWQARLQAMMNERGGAALEVDELLDGDDIAQAAAAVFNNDPVFLRLGGMNAIIQQFHEDTSDDGDEDPHDDDDDATGQADMDAESDDDGSTTMADAADETASEFGMVVSSPVVSSAVQVRQARTVSISSHAL